MSHKLARFSKSLLEQPQLITAAKFQEIAEILEDRNNGLYRMSEISNDLEMLSEGSSRVGGLVGETIGVLNIEGPTTYKSTGFEAICGGVSYQSLLVQMEELVKLEDINVILMNINSPGGEAFRAFETARSLRKMADDNNKMIIAYVDGIAASAGFALASAAHEVIVNPDSEVGSIGVVIRLVNVNKMLEKDGIEVKYITAGSAKVPFDEDGEFREEFISDLQKRVTELYDNFVVHISKHRDMDEEVVRATEAKMFNAEDALTLGLIDGIMEGDTFNEHLAEASANFSSDNDEDKDRKSVTKVIPKTQKENLMSDDKKIEASVVDAEQLASMQEQMKEQAKVIATFQAKELAVEKEKVSASLESAPFLKECKEDVLSFLMSTDVSEGHKTLMNSVISKSKAAQDAVTEEAAAKVVEAEAKVETAEAEKEEIKKEFATSQHSVEGELTESVKGGSTLADKIAAKKAALAAT